MVLTVLCSIHNENVKLAVDILWVRLLLQLDPSEKLACSYLDINARPFGIQHDKFTMNEPQTKRNVAKSLFLFKVPLSEKTSVLWNEDFGFTFRTKKKDKSKINMLQWYQFIPNNKGTTYFIFMCQHWNNICISVTHWRPWKWLISLGIPAGEEPQFKRLLLQATKCALIGGRFTERRLPSQHVL